MINLKLENILKDQRISAALLSKVLRDILLNSIPPEQLIRLTKNRN